MLEQDIVVIGIGNEFRTDDGVGLLVARKIMSVAPDGVKTVIGVPDGYALMDEWADANRVYVIDCACSGAQPGTVYRFDAIDDVIPEEIFSGLSTHSVTINNAIDLARVLDRLPRRMTVFGIEGKEYTTGTEISTEVLEGADRVTERILEDIKTHQNHKTTGQHDA